MSSPIVELIALEIKDRVEQVTVANGYNTTIHSVHRPGWTPTQSIVDGLVILVTGDAIRNEELSSQGNPPAVAWDQNFHLLCYVRPDDTDDTPVDSLIAVFASDVMKSVCVPEESWMHFDNNAINAMWTANERMENDGTYDGFVLTLTVTYRTEETDPYTVR